MTSGFGGRDARLIMDPFHMSNEPNEKFTNLPLPNYLENLLEKGPKFRAPHVLDNVFKNKTKLQLKKQTYKLRWDNKMKEEPKRGYEIPFS